MANLMLSVMGAFAEFERSLIHERQRGAYHGSKKALSTERIAELQGLAAAGEQKKSKIARKFGISRETVYQYLRMVD